MRATCPARTHRRDLEDGPDHDRARTMPRRPEPTRPLRGTTVAVGTVAPAPGCPPTSCPTCGGSDLSNDGLIAQARSQIGELNAGYGGNPSPNCNDGGLAVRVGEYGVDDGNDTVEHQGYLRWVPDFADDPTPPRDGPSIEWYQQVCYVPGPPSMELRAASWRRFDAVSPEAWRSSPSTRCSPGDPRPQRSGVTTVPTAWSPIDTWFWIDGACSRAPVSAVVGQRARGRGRSRRPSPEACRSTSATAPRSSAPTSARPYVAGGRRPTAHTPTTTAGTLHDHRERSLWHRQLHGQRRSPFPIETARRAHRARRRSVVNEAQAINTGNG